MHFIIPTTLALIASATLALVLAHPLPSGPDHHHSQVSAVLLVRRALPTTKAGGKGTVDSSPPAPRNIGVNSGNTSKKAATFGKQVKIPKTNVQKMARAIDKKVEKGGKATVAPK
ncbi:hypothetical protein H4R33_002395 [Dimargaris cristalligena]|uniref:Uncharacterized protein n=1 Tax=Dimargaris cristalligena TaxID=215637 RepID=A0A4Q0A0F9_9FUNG|nr:hypothetical protein H4R33_002395 [Dimargaris cristalligena]RKP39208.1 hypothetical protein BJ085DRAFT_30290 [Dimargaris cristalligena]|eukprot:RKP39208.1 hypothetical protein BJ085DRAFT_30290 [Dimargaris cristalligena]